VDTEVKVSEGVQGRVKGNGRGKERVLSLRLSGECHCN